MMDEIRCATCDFVTVSARSKATKNNAHLERPRGYCYCTHVGAEEAAALRGHSTKNGAGISWTIGSSDTPAVKTTPVWCPRKLMYHPLHTSYERLLDVIETGMPLGIVWSYNFDARKFVAVDNRTGEAIVEEFDDYRSCDRWLNSIVSAEATEQSCRGD